ncbi:MAG: hypothetical protein H6557_04480 [Lewinellaceae bacterium]|nr:hypothetical protein [Lewinellaceae bacterium]
MNVQVTNQTQVFMGAEQIKEILHLRIEQADESFLRILHAMTEAYAHEHLEESKEQRIASYEASLKPMTKEELVARALASQEDIEAGRLHDIEEVEQKLGL